VDHKVYTCPVCGAVHEPVDEAGEEGWLMCPRCLDLYVIENGELKIWDPEPVEEDDVDEVGEEDLVDYIFE